MFPSLRDNPTRRENGWVESTYILMSRSDSAAVAANVVAPDGEAWPLGARIDAKSIRRRGNMRDRRLDRPAVEGDDATTLWARLAMPEIHGSRQSDCQHVRKSVVRRCSMAADRWISERNDYRGTPFSTVSSLRMSKAVPRSCGRSRHGSFAARGGGARSRHSRVAGWVNEVRQCRASSCPPSRRYRRPCGSVPVPLRCPRADWPAAHYDASVPLKVLDGFC